MLRLAVVAALIVAGIVYARRRVDPTLFKERRRPGGATQDPAALVLIRLSALASVVLLTLDRAWLHWSDVVPAAIEWIGVALFTLAGGLVVTSVVANRFFSSAVRIQGDRGHHVIVTGPYGIVRHPGYLGMMTMVPALMLAGGSWMAAAVGLTYSALIGRRASTEDRFLQQKLDGYLDYARRVRYRLVPFVW